MPDLITLAIPAFVALLFAEAIAGAIMRRDIFGNPGWHHDDAAGANSSH
jgi:hypothetical protein